VARTAAASKDLVDRRMKWFLEEMMRYVFFEQIGLEAATKRLAIR
jgi:hypothetical protein